MKKTVDFWKEVLADPIRLVAWILILMMFCWRLGFISLIISVVLLAGATYVCGNIGVLDEIDWKNAVHQKGATAISFAILAATIFLGNGILAVLVAAAVIVVIMFKK